MRTARTLPLLLALAVATEPALAEETPRRVTVEDRRRRRAVDAGLAYLAKNQKTDGSWGSVKAGTVGITSLALLAFLAQGHQEDRGQYGDVVRRGVDFLMKRSLAPDPKRPNVSTVPPYPPGFIYVSGDADSRMHGHGYATQVLLLVYGTSPAETERSRSLRLKIQRAIKVIEDSQTVTGGWGYAPHRATFHEGSVTVTVVQALRLASNAGFVVSSGTHERGLRYLHDSQKGDGSFKYSIMNDRSTAALTAAALTAMHGFGEYYGKAVREGLDYLRDKYGSPETVEWLFYANYYAAQVFYRAGDRYWEAWERSVVPFILSMQYDDGSWDDRRLGLAPRAHGRAYATAMACLSLSVQDGYLPLFQK